MNCVVSVEPYLAAISKLPQELFSCAVVAKVSSFTGQVSSILFL